jgi:hypothetical protein
MWNAHMTGWALGAKREIDGILETELHQQADASTLAGAPSTLHAVHPFAGRCLLMSHEEARAKLHLLHQLLAVPKQDLGNFGLTLWSLPGCAIQFYYSK